MRLYLPKESAVVGKKQSGTQFTCFTSTNGLHIWRPCTPELYMLLLAYLRSELTHAVGLAKSIENDAASSEAVGKQLPAIHAVYGDVIRPA
jgi:hypothetical protein